LGQQANIGRQLPSGTEILENSINGVWGVGILVDRKGKMKYKEKSKTGKATFKNRKRLS